MSEQTPPDDQPSVQDDLNQLLGTGLGMAQEQLEAQGAFLPTALVTTTDGEIRVVGLSPEEDNDDVDADAMLTDLYSVLQQQREDHRAVVVVSDIHLPEEETDAIHLAAEHAEGTTVSIMSPYSRDATTNEFNYGKLMGEEGARVVWADPQ